MPRNLIQLMQARLDKIANNACLTKRFKRFQPVQSFEQYKPSLASPKPNRRHLTFFQHTFGDLFNFRRVQRFHTLRGYINFGDRECLFL